MTKSSKSDAVPYAVGGAILLFGILSAVSVLVPAAKEGPRLAVAAPATAASSTMAAVAPAVPPIAVAQAASSPVVPASAASTAFVTPDLAAAASAVAVMPVAAPATPVETPAQPVLAKTAEMGPAKADPTTAVDHPKPVLKPVVVAKPPRQERATAAVTAPPTLVAQVPAGLPAPTMPFPAPNVQSVPLEGPKAFTAPPTASKKEPVAAVEQPVKTSTGGSGPALVTASGNKAWIRLDDRRTVAVEKGQSLEGYGAFIGIEKGVAKFERGSVASKAETVDASARN